jgi:hypothetical protein
MTTIVIAPSNVVTFPEGGGHFWVYMQYVQGFLKQGCDVYWLENFVSSGDEARDANMLTEFSRRMDSFGLKGKAILYSLENTESQNDAKINYIGVLQTSAESVFRNTDLLLNFYYAMDPVLLNKFKRTALVDIDPGLLQFWMSTGQLTVTAHDYYLTTGETVGTPAARFPDCGLDWIKIQPPVCLDSWPYSYDPGCKNFSTVSGWWGGGGKGEWISDGEGLMYENNKRVTFLQFIDLPGLTPQGIELALNLGTGEPDSGSSSSEPDDSPDDDDGYVTDNVQRQILLEHGWQLRHSYEVAASPSAYRSYIQQSRGEFSCVKPSCLKFQNAWISDRTICYLASGKPVVVQNTGKSEFLPDGNGMFRFSTIEEAVDAFAAINSDYERHCRAAREIAETFFDATKIAERIINRCVT